MRDVEIPDWLKGLPLAPEFRPTDTEFADPIAYISKIEKEASAFGICKVIPPLPKPSKKYVISNLNKTLSKCPELGSDVNLSGVYSSSNNGDKDKENGMEVLRAVFTTRQQELGQDIKKTKGSVHPQSPAVHKQVWQSGEVYTLEQFESKSKVFARSQLASVKDVSPIVIEALFWEAASEKPIYVEYANDVPGSGFGEPEGHFKYFRRRRRRRGSFDRNKKYLGESLGNSHTPFIEASRPSSSSFSPSGLSNQILKDSKKVDIEVEGTAGWKLSNSPWNLQVIARSPGSLTRFMPDDIPGVTSPMVYIGMLFSWFAWHVEDHELHSLNFLHTGSSKTWYAVPGDYAFVFEEVIRTQAYGGNIDRFTALKLLGEKTSLLSPEIVVAAGIPCCRLVQNPGEFVVTFPRAYHVGFSHGFNCGEAANFGTPRWLTVAKEAAVRRAAMNFLPMLSHQQLLYLLAMSFVSRVPRSLLPGARSSRLRDRQKEERELLVKKALIEDILNENNLLTLLLQKNPSYRTVLWDVDLLPSSSSKESETRSSITTDPSALINAVSPQIDQDQDLLTQMSSYMENLNDLYLDDDMSCDLEVDSGTMPCLACGILGFPFMTVVQPLDQASMNIMAKDDCKIEDRGVFKPLESNSLICRKLTIKGPTPPIQDDIDNKDKTINHSSKNFEKSSVNAQSFSSVTAGLMKFDETHLPKEVPLDKGWNTSTGLLRPRIFCLEHALEVEKLLRPKGGANVLVICHSDFQKIKAQAAAIAEEIKISFNYKEIQLDNATPEDLNLINLAVDNEEHDDEFKEDWTFKLGVNLRQSMKVRTNFPNQKLQISLNLVGLFPNSISISISNDLNLMWRSRKYRSKRNLNRLIRHKSAERLPEMIGAKSLRKEGELLKYSRRSNKSKLCGFSMGSKGSSDCENLEKNVGNVENRVCNSSVCGETEKHGQNLLENGTGETENMGNTCLEVAESGKIELESETQAGVQTEKSLLLEVVDSEMLGSGCEESEEIGCNQLKNGAGETENMGNPCLDVAGSGNSDLQHATPASVSREKSLTLKAVDSEMSVSGCEESEKNGSIETENARNPSLEVAGSGKFELQRETPVSVLGEKSPPLRVVDSEMSVSVCFEESENNDRNWSENGAREPENIGSPCLELAGSGKSDLQHETPASVSTEELGEKSLPAKVGEINDRNRSETGTGNTKNAQNPCRESELKHETPVTDEHIPMNDVSNNLSSDKKVVRNRNKRKREMDLIEEDQICFNGFTRSPCEGLRPRSTKDVNKPIPKKPKPKLQKKIMEKKGSGTSFRCTIKGCRKKFRSHKYAVLHQRVHEDDRPLKCPWKGCGVSFKWAWARTEHIRVHTGERPYECKVEGCGLTFRFISDYSRHKRKTGHYVDSQS